MRQDKVPDPGGKRGLGDVTGLSGARKGAGLAEGDQELQLAERWNDHRFDLWPNGKPSKFLFVACEICGVVLDKGKSRKNRVLGENFHAREGGI